MKLEEFARSVGLAAKTELEKVELVAYFFHKTEGKGEFARDDVSNWFNRLNLGNPNVTRLTQKMRESRRFVRGSTPQSFKLHAITLDELQQDHPGLRSESEDVESEDTILPRPVYESTRGFIESLSKQINASYEYNIYDGCAVLMRRLTEMLLILAYEHLGIEAEVQDAQGHYKPLEKIIENAKANSTLKLSRDSKVLVDEFRQLGNFSAHKIYYNCRRGDLRRITLQYRATIEELLYKAALRK
jgi:hypothetical protein